MNNWLKTLPTDFAALLLGVMLTLAFAPYEVFPFAVLAPAGLLFLWLSSSPKRAGWLGFLFGLGFFSTSTYWIFISIHEFGDVPGFLAGFITFGFAAILALFPATVGFTLNRYFPTLTSLKILGAFPSLWLCSEWVRTWIFTGFPWLFLGYSQTNSPLKGFAPIFSVYGVTLAVLLSSGLLVNAVRRIQQKAYQSAYYNLFFFLTIWTVGALLVLVHWTAPIEPPVSVSLVQGNIPQSVKWTPEKLSLSLNRYEALSEPLWGKSKLIIWPEAAIPLPLQEAASYLAKMDEKARGNDTALLLGIPVQSLNGSGYYNALISLGSEKKAYYKYHLVPFGEYTPSVGIFTRFMHFMDIPMSDMIPGDTNQEPITIGKTKILPFICYEIAYPVLFKTYDPSINLLLTITNSAWFGKSSAQAQMLQMAEMRALEFGRSVVFVGNDGITAIIGPDGNIEESVPPHEMAVLSGTVERMGGSTPWMRTGMDPILFIMLCLFLAARFHCRERKPILTHENAKQTNPVKL
ncbi:MAG: apolipoprotein N-acyltransferase [Gammaproteobacteria bacterium RIFCSPHIGHO2_12_FULL_43_28]|nr:MAG: apolipoprotein N-acyltransferase [Gammaproteobacteria bacterium RIFCSPHIGHO2_12_FULL_43_28]